MSIPTLERNGTTTATGNRVTVVIPARNEAPSIRAIIEGCKLYADEILVVDGHSTDGTPEIAADLGARVVTDNGIGKGDAIRVGIAEATGDVIVFIDADGSHSPDDIPGMVQPIGCAVQHQSSGSGAEAGSAERR